VILQLGPGQKLKLFTQRGRTQRGRL